MKIALAQINTTVGDFEGNTSLIIDRIHEAREQKAGLIIFPEMAICGYPPLDLVEYRSFVDQNLRSLERIQKETQGLACVVGYIDRNPRESVRKYYNTAVVLSEGRVLARYAKKLLPNYDVFDEYRYFEPGQESGVFTIGDQTFGLSICEDIWNDKDYWKKWRYDHDPIEEQVKQGAKFLINISASPFSIHKGRWRRDIIRSLAQKYSVPIFYVNLVGGNDELIFDGRSLVVNSQGEIVAEVSAFEEDLFIVDTDHLKSLDSPLVSEDCEEAMKALVLGIRDYLHKCGFQKAVLGLSGGIDSALTAVLAVKALGPENVLGVLMPSMYSSPGSLKDSEKLAKSLGIQTETIPIQDVYKVYEKIFKKIFPKKAPDVTEENIQARIRGNLLMAISNKQGVLLLTTGNKSELGVGYCTLYGDMNGGLAVIADLTKTMAYDMSRYLNRDQEIIPQAIIEKPPSAELKPDQKDEDSLPPYEVLDAILALYVEEHQDVPQIIEKGFDPEVVKRVVRLVDQNEFKRRQASPGLRVTEKAFGMGRRFPIARKIPS